MNTNQKCILAVDDDNAILETFKELLESEGYVVDTATNGKEAIQKLNSKHYDLALLDLKLPDMEGTDLLAKIQRGKTVMQKIMITGFPSQENAMKALNLGANAYIIKPTDPENLLKVVAQKLKKQEA